MAKDMTTKTSSSKPPAIPSVTDAEAVIRDLEKQRSILVEERAADDVDMSRVAYAAHARHEPEANRQLDEITERRIRHDQRIREIDAALVTAKSVLEDAHRAERAAAEHKAAGELRAVLKDMCAAGEACDVALALLVEASNRLSASLDAIHAAGFSHPHHQQLMSMAERATVSALMELPWKRAFRPGSSVGCGGPARCTSRSRVTYMRGSSSEPAGHRRLSFGPRWSATCGSFWTCGRCNPGAPGGV